MFKSDTTGVEYFHLNRSKTCAVTFWFASSIAA